VDDLSRRLREYQNAYYITGRPLVSDAEYDLLFDRLLALEAENPELIRDDSPTRRVGSDLSNEFPEFRHTIPVLSLDKVYTGQALLGWMAKTADSASAATGAKEIGFVAEEKIDGVSIVLYYTGGSLVRAVTRGNGFVGNDVTENVKTIGSVPLRLSRPIDCVVRGEIYLPVSSFSRINDTLDLPYANPRNLAAGTIRRVKSREVASVPLQIFVYEGFFPEALPSHVRILEELEDLGFRLNPRTGFFGTSVPGELRLRHPGWTIGDLSATGLFLEAAARERKGLDYEIDGLVFKVNEIPVREELGYTGHHPRWAVAYKFESPEGLTRVDGIDVQVGRTGRVTPVARVQSVKVGGTTISNITLHNQDYIDLLELAVGDSVAISRRGDVIPAVERVVEKNDCGNTTFRIPAECPSCGSLLVRSGAHHFCRNRECPAQIRGRLLFFVARGQMDIETLGPETVDTLVRLGLVREIEDLYTCDYRRLGEVQGFGQKKIAAIEEGVRRSREKPFQVLLRSLGIPELGQKAAELLVSNGFTTMSGLLALSDAGKTEPLTAIPGIGEKTAATILSELARPELRRTVEALARAGLPMEERPEAGREELPQTFAGQTWCVTGSFERFKPRSLAMDEVRRRGGKVVSSVSGSTTHLLAGTGAGGKLDDALRLGVRIVHEEEFLRLLGGRGASAGEKQAGGSPADEGEPRP